MTEQSRHRRSESQSAGNHRPVRLRAVRATRLSRYLRAMVTETHFLKILLLLLVLWASFSGAFYLAERNAPGAAVTTYGEALYWSTAAFSTAGIADTPKSGLAMAIGGLWIVTGSVIFFGTIVGSITGYFMRPVQRPVNRIVETIEYNLENLQDLSSEELALLKQTTDSLLLHMEALRDGGSRRHDGGNDD